MVPIVAGPEEGVGRCSDPAALLWPLAGRDVVSEVLLRADAAHGVHLALDRGGVPFVVADHLFGGRGVP